MRTLKLNTKGNTNAQPKKKKEKSVKDIYETFVTNISSVEIFFRRLAPMAETEDEAIISEKNTFVSRCFEETFGCTFEDVESEKVTVDLTEDKVKSFLYKALQAPKIPAQNYSTLTRGAFIMLNNYFEFLFSDLLSYHFKKNNSTFDNKKVSISFEELKKYNSIDEAYEDLVYKEVEALLIDLNFEELKQYFTEKLKISLEEKIVDWSLINEIRERRHIIVHNNSIVNSKYLKRSGNPFSLTANTEILIEKEYFIKAFGQIKLAGTILCLNCWGSWDKDDVTTAITKIMDLSFEGLKDKNYEFVKNLCGYAERNIKAKNDEQEDIMYRIKFNYFLALKRLNEKEELEKKLSEIKTSVLTPIFKMACLILSDNFEDAIKLIKKAMVADELTLDRYRDWPLFEEIRSQEPLNLEAVKAFSA